MLCKVVFYLTGYAISDSIALWKPKALTAVTAKALFEKQKRLLTPDSKQINCEPVANERQGSHDGLSQLQFNM